LLFVCALHLPPIKLSGQNSDKSDETDELIVKILASIGAAALVVLILLYANGYFRSTDRMNGRNQFHNTGQRASESEAERLRVTREAESQRIAQEEERLRIAREAERQRKAQEAIEAERQRVAQEAERERKAQEGIEAERQRKAQEGIDAELKRKAQEEDRQRIAQEEAEKKKRDDNLKQCFQAAEETYSANWDMACRQIGSPPKCILPPAVLARFDGPRRDARDECARLYAVK